ncbi:VirB8/TrbF family protein [Acidithiobacillus ferrooxidans]|uniref:VirB8/TrbF family protein n=1 Tax=Acidithiobacillus ferrooxidans TaxID=920 RepID=UPI00214B0588|nr:VirB8/TrbF family protein [Acidithiobacillus ferrooxidans]MCR2830541.1 VirB8/TrbF family protein [Acidithiobacillus ferrooxidans]
MAQSSGNTENTKIGVGSSNPYLNARREWDDRQGDALTRAHNWKIMAFGAIAVAGIAVAGIAYIGAQSKIEPFVVAIDKMGNPIAMAQPVAGGAVNQRIIEAQIAAWVWNWRSMLSDPMAQKQLLAQVYAMASTQTAAEINPWYKKSWTADAGYVVSPHITSILPVSKSTYQVNWTETKYQNGQSDGTRSYKGNVTVGIDKKIASTAQASMLNPLGIYVQSITWTKVLSN